LKFSQLRRTKQERKKNMEAFTNKIGKCWGVFTSVACICILVNVTMVVSNILMRRFFNMPIWGSTEFVKYISLITASLALVQNEWFDGNIRMTILPESISIKSKQILDVFVNVICTIAFIFVSYLLVRQAISKYVKWDVSADLHLPIFIFATVLAIGFVVLTLGIAFKALLSVYTLKAGVTFNLRTVRTLEQE
jgi:TRAP-type mannitol/chloroaromatic compound transport system permease small subunit